MSARTAGRRCAVTLAAGLLAAGVSGPVALAGDLTFSEALRIARLGPRAARASADTEGRFGLFQEESGRFDWTAGVGTRFARDRGELRRAQIEREQVIRNAEHTLLDELTRIADDLDRQLQENSGRPIPPECKSFLLVVNGRDVCISDIERNDAQTFDEVLRALINTTDDPDERSELERIQARLDDQARQFAGNAVIALRDQAEIARIQIERLGAVPHAEQRYTFGLDFGLRRLARNGIAASAGLSLEGQEDNYSGKSIRPGYGGKGIPRTYLSLLSIGLDIPLGRGRGRSTTGAPVQAAELDYAASLSLFDHRSRESELAAAIAYWRLAAAQERLDLLDRALDDSGLLRSDIGALASQEELPPVEVSRADARVASVRRDRERAARDLQSAQARLAEALGVPLSAGAPRAAEPLPPPAAFDAVEGLRASKLIRASLGRRGDVAAARLVTRASEVLLQGARGNLRRTFDFSLSVGYSGLNESFTRPLLQPAAYGHSLSGRAVGPSFAIALKTNAPFANRRALGQLEQSAALAARSSIEGGDLERGVGLEVTDALAALRAAAAETARRGVARERSTDVWKAARELLRSGEGNVLDTVVTDEERVQAALNELAARERWAVALARLRFAVGLPVIGGVPGLEAAGAPGGRP